MLISAKEIIQQSIALYKKHFSLFFHYAMLLLVGTVVAILLSQLLSLLFSTPSPNGIVYKPLLSSAMVVLAWVIYYIFSLWISVAMIQTIKECYEGKKPKVLRVTTSNSIKLVWPMFVVSIIAGLIIFGGMLLLVIPGTIFSVWYAFSVYAVIFDNKKNMAALTASKQLVAGKWWGVLWRLFAPSFVFGVLLLLIEGILSLIEAGILLLAPGTPLVTGALSFASLNSGTLLFMFTMLAVYLGSLLITLLITTLFTIAPTILYIELKKSVTK
ncbi:MAG: hypothetical protein CL685_03585 [Candidatus Magasanikbacteria bacterium]|nr:hypothetical protein [Candidatus Magasanikbacteria bacterium]|tara:strand:+ start:479 stop:1291 length:813 start_codon:yes stop_codon:yes gene_type:complete